MRPFETVAAARTPDGRELSLHRRGDDWFIQLDGDELMSTRRSASERALGELACRALDGVRRPRVLIGGLGLGFTLRAVLDGLGPAEVVVAEVFPDVVEWGRTHLRDVHGPSLGDPRLRIDARDVWDLLAPGSAWDAVLLDVDNGPEAWCLDRNERLYADAGLARIASSLAPSGVLAVWSARPAPGLERRLRAAGWEVADHPVHAHGAKGTRHHVIVARRAGPARRRSRAGRGR